MMKDIVLSIITVCFNSEKSVTDTVKSIAKQMTDEVEYVVVDGGSRDRTLAIIREHVAGENITIISEPDHGIYDAMNKGISLAKGKWMLFINSDDCIKDGVLKKMLPILKQTEGYGCVCTNVEMIRPIGEIRYRKLWKAVVPSDELKWGMLCSHQGMYLNREVTSALGGFDTNFPIVADWDLFYRIYAKGMPIQYVDVTTAECLEGGASGHQVVWEKHLVRKKNHVYRVLDWGLFADAAKRLKAEVATLLLGDKKALIVAKRKYKEN